MDSNWWQATLNGETGLVPLTHVVELHSLDDGHLCNLWSAAMSSSDDSKSVTNSGLVGSTVIADTDLTAQLDYELQFSRGDIIFVLEDLGDGFAIGECNGAVGQFPLYFCTPTDPQTASVLPPPEMPPSINTMSRSNSPMWKKGNSRPGSYTLANTWSQDCSVIPYCSTLYDFRGRTSEDELSFGPGEIIYLISHLDDDWCFGELDGRCGAFPTSYVDIIVDCDTALVDQVQSEIKTETAAAVPMVTETASAAAVPMVTETTSSSNQPAGHGSNTADLYGRLICDFVALNVNEVDAAEGETVTVLQHLSDGWLQVRLDSGRVGLCPASFIELFGAEPKLAAVKPDIQTPSVVKPKPPVKPKLLTATTKNHGVSSGTVDQNKTPPSVVSNPPLLSPQPIRDQPDNNAFQPSAACVLSSPTAEMPKSPPYTPKSSPHHATVVTNSCSRPPPPLSNGLDELIRSQLTTAKSVAHTAPASGRDIKPSNQKMPSGQSIGASLNGVADVAGQSTWYRFSEDEEACTVTIRRKAPPPPRPAPSRPPQISTAASTLPRCGSKDGPDVVDGLRTPKKPPTNLIEFSPDNQPSK